MEENIRSCDECMLNPCAECMRYVTGIEFVPEEVLDFNEAMSTNMSSTGEWFGPYNKVLKKNGLDTIFFSFKDHRLHITESTPINHYMFNTLPDGKCVILGIDENKFFKSVVCIMDDGYLELIYDPTSDESPLAEIYEIGFFIRTYTGTNDV